MQGTKNRHLQVDWYEFHDPEDEFNGLSCELGDLCGVETDSVGHAQGRGYANL